MDIKPYTYFIFNKITNQFYIGSRRKNVAEGRSPEEDLWKLYFTSSKPVSKLIEEHGKESFSTEIIYVNRDEDEEDLYYWYEQFLISEHFSNSLCLNLFYVDPVTKSRIVRYGWVPTYDGFLRFEKVRKQNKKRKESLDEIAVSLDNRARKITHREKVLKEHKLKFEVTKAKFKADLMNFNNERAKFKATLNEKVDEKIEEIQQSFAKERTSRLNSLARQEEAFIAEKQRYEALSKMLIEIANK